MQNPSFNELEKRILEYKKSEKTSGIGDACWLGYLAALVEWDLITVDSHHQLLSFFSRFEDDPTRGIFLGY